MKKIKLANNTYVDSRILGISIGCADEEYEYYFPKKAKKERVEQIEKIKKLICEFEKNGDTDSLKFANERLDRAEEALDLFCKDFPTA
jgi:hypothetical protein